MNPFCLVIPRSERDRELLLARVGRKQVSRCARNDKMGVNEMTKWG